MSLARSTRQYMGVRAILPPDLQMATRAPTSADKAYVKGTLWLDTAASTAFMWPGSGNWISLGSGTTGAIVTLTGDSGGAISPVAGNIDILGTQNNIVVTGTAGTLTLALDEDIEIAGSLEVATSLLVGTDITSTQGNLTVTDGNIVITQGDFTASDGNIESVQGSVTAGTTVQAGTSITAALGNITATNGNLVLGTSGNKIMSTSVGTTTTAGANSFGKVSLSSGSAIVSTTSVKTASIIILTTQVLGTVAAPMPIAVTARTDSTSFTITSSDGTDTSSIGWMIIN